MDPYMGSNRGGEDSEMPAAPTEMSWTDKMSLLPGLQDSVQDYNHWDAGVARFKATTTRVDRQRGRPEDFIWLARTIMFEVDYRSAGDLMLELASKVSSAESPTERSSLQNLYDSLRRSQASTHDFDTCFGGGAWDLVESQYDNAKRGKSDAWRATGKYYNDHIKPNLNATDFAVMNTFVPGADTSFITSLISALHPYAVLRSDGSITKRGSHDGNTVTEDPDWERLILREMHPGQVPL